MSISVRLRRVFATGAAAIVLCALPALGQDALGKFSLDREVHWGPATLVPGTYSYSLEHHATEIVVLRPVAGGPGYLMTARSVARANPSSSDNLLLQKKGDAWFVSSLTISKTGEELQFAVPSAVLPKEAPKVASTSTP
jgi:hypothetical protein